jgi:hypothetical protein
VIGAVGRHVRSVPKTRIARAAGASLSGGSRNCAALARKTEADRQPRILER